MIFWESREWSQKLPSWWNEPIFRARVELKLVLFILTTSHVSTHYLQPSLFHLNHHFTVTLSLFLIRIRISPIHLPIHADQQTATIPLFSYPYCIRKDITFYLPQLTIGQPNYAVTAQQHNFIRETLFLKEIQHLKRNTFFLKRHRKIIDLLASLIQINEFNRTCKITHLRS